MPLKLATFLSKPTDIASLVFLRVGFGLLMFWEHSRYFWNNWIEELYVQQEFHFKYEWFTWVEPLPEKGMYLIFTALAICSLMIIFGWFYRWSMTVFFGLYLYVFLIDQAYYNNHFYAILILSFLMIFTPLHHGWSVDSWRGRVRHVEKLPALWLWLMRFPMSMVYVYGAFAKIQSDWLTGKATAGLLGKGTEGTFLEPLMSLQGTAIFYAWTGMLFDLFVPFGVLWKPTRIPMFLAAIFFHSHNYYVFPIGVFPPLSLTLTLLYFDPDFPRKLLPSGIKQKCRNSYFSSLKSSDSMLDHLPRKILLGTLGIFVFVQLILPFRHFLNPGWTLWHEEGHYFAWRMMLRQKVIEIRYDLTHPVTKEIRYAPLEDYLNSSQIRTFAGNPGMVLLFAHHLKDLVKKNAGFTPIVTAEILISLNGRPKMNLVDPLLNLADIDPYKPAYYWVTDVKP
jgi:hypothetical protein